MDSIPSQSPDRSSALVTLLCYLPYVGFIRGIDVQPFFFLVAMVGILPLVTQLRFSEAALFQGFFALVVLRLVIQGYAAPVDNDVLASFASTMFHIAVIALCKILVSFRLFAESGRVFATAIGIYVLVGSVQLVYPNFMSFAVYRGFAELAETGRGVRSLASEPAVFGNLLTILNIYLVYFLHFQRPARNTTLLLLSGGLLMGTLFLSQSFYAVFYHYVIVLMLVYFMSKAWFLVALLGSAALPGMLLLLGESSGSRFFTILEAAYQNPVLLYQQGAFLRVLNAPVSIYGGFLHGWFGSGFAPAHYAAGELPVFDGAPYYFEVGDRIAGGVVELVLRLGLLSLPILAWYFRALFQVYSMPRSKDRQEMAIGKWAAISIFLVSFLYSSMGNPLVWVILFLFLQRVPSHAGMDRTALPPTWPSPLHRPLADRVRSLVDGASPTPRTLSLQRPRLNR